MNQDFGCKVQICSFSRHTICKKLIMIITDKALTAHWCRLLDLTNMYMELVKIWSKSIKTRTLSDEYVRDEGGFCLKFSCLSRTCEHETFPITVKRSIYRSPPSSSPVSRQSKGSFACREKNPHDVLVNRAVRLRFVSLCSVIRWPSLIHHGVWCFGF